MDVEELLLERPTNALLLFLNSLYLNKKRNNAKETTRPHRSTDLSHRFRRKCFWLDPR